MLRAFLLLLMVLAAPAYADRKVALVIGNSAYTYAPALPNPQNDAAEVAKKLTSLGYEVQLEENLTGQAFRTALGVFSETAQQADLALVFYAGHGIELNGRNFLIPIDSEMKSEASAQFETVSLDQVLSTVRSARTLGIVMLDACRDNPFASSMKRANGTRSVSRGLAPVSVEGDGGLVVSFAAEAGNTASDGDSGHSPYTEAFLEVLDQPDLEVGKMFRTLRAKVREKSKGKQVPVEQAQLPDHDVFITPVSGTVVPVTPQPIAPPVVPVPDASAQFFEAARENDPAKLNAFIASYPDHPRAADARKLVEDIEDDQMWAQVAAEGTEAAGKRYILVFPNGKHTIAASLLLDRPAPAPIVEPTQIGPTFDCGKATTDVELAICSTGSLALQDHTIVGAFKRALAAGWVTKAQQKAWVLSREAFCAGRGDAVADCVYQYTAARIAELGG
ncbi:MAG: caspase family protein [Cypionkella sp.]